VSIDSFSLHLFEGIGFFGLFLIIVQAIAGLFVGHDGDTEADANIDVHGGHGGYASYLSLKSISAIFLGFGFGSAVIERAGYSSSVSALGGLVIGVAISASYLTLMKSLYALKTDGTAVLAEAVNRTGTVYLTIPAENAGSGEIQVSYGGRLQNVRAFTKGPVLTAGTAVRVLALHGEQAVVVEKIS
jgi:membrane protein implicated in regulation of membrane protease activity